MLEGYILMYVLGIHDDMAREDFIISLWDKIWNILIRDALCGQVQDCPDCRDAVQRLRDALHHQVLASGIIICIILPIICPPKNVKYLFGDRIRKNAIFRFVGSLTRFSAQSVVKSSPASASSMYVLIIMMIMMMMVMMMMVMMIVTVMMICIWYDI